MKFDYKPIVAAAIEKAGSGNKLARYLGVTASAVSQMRNGITKPSTDNMAAILKLLGKMCLVTITGAFLTWQTLPSAEAAQNMTRVTVYYVKWLRHRLTALIREFLTDKNMKPA